MSSGAIDAAASIGTAPGMDPGVDRAVPDTIVAAPTMVDARVITAAPVAVVAAVNGRDNLLLHWRRLFSAV